MQEAIAQLIRVCRKCSRELPIGEYYRDARSPGGHRTACKACTLADVARRHRAKVDEIQAYQAKYREAHRAEARARTAAYRLSNPDRVRKAQEQFLSVPENRIIARERARAFRLANPDLRSEYEKRRRARKKSTVIGLITPEQLAAKAAYWGNRCWMCGGKPQAWDHVKPLSKQGPHMLANLRPACNPCNLRKSDRWPYAVVLTKVG